MILENITIERLEEIEQERLETQMDPAYQQWFDEMHISRLYVSREGITNANRMMADYSH